LLRAVPLWLATSSWIAQAGGPLTETNAPRYGGIVGFYIAKGFHSLFGLGGGRIFLSLFLLVVLIILFKPWLGWVPGLLNKLGGVTSFFGSFFSGIGSFFSNTITSVESWFSNLSRKKSVKGKTSSLKTETNSAPEAKAAVEETPTEPRIPRQILFDDPEPDEAQPQPGTEDVEQLNLSGATGEFHGDIEGEAEFEQSIGTGKKVKKTKKKKGPIVFPGLELLTPGSPETTHRSTDELDAAADLLESTP